MKVPDMPSIAVLPFANMSVDPELDYFSDSLTNTIIGAHSRLPGILVIALTSNFAYKGKPLTIKKVAEEFGVQFVLN